MRKKCSKCGMVKELSEFGISNNSSDGYQNYCKSCLKKYNKTKKTNPILIAQLLEIKGENEMLKKLLINKWLADEKVGLADGE